MMSLAIICESKGPSGKIYRELFEPDIIFIFLNAYEALAESTLMDDSKKTLMGIRNGYDDANGVRIFSKPILYILDKAVQRNFDPTWQKTATEEFESGEFSYMVDDLKVIVEEEKFSFHYGNPAVQVQRRKSAGAMSTAGTSGAMSTANTAGTSSARDATGAKTWVTDGNPDDYDIDEVLQDLVSKLANIQIKFGQICG